MRPRRPALAIAALTLVAAACGGPDDAGDAGPGAAAPSDRSPATSAPATPAPTADASDEPGTVPEALDFVAPALDGGQVRGAEYAGGDVVLWMWAPW